METTTLYYLSGTGNSLFVAKELYSRIPNSKIIPIISLLNDEHITISSESIGFIFPLQGPMYPTAIKFFIEKSDFTKVKYIFAIATRGGTTCRIRQEIDKLLRKKRRCLNAHFVITVFNNDPKLKNSHNNDYGFRVPSEEEILKQANEIKEKVEKISQIIIAKEESHRKDTEYSYKYGFLLEKVVIFATKLMSKKSIPNYFYADDKCIGCGLCSKVCLSNRITVIDKKPMWNDKILCHMCYACLNFCPKKAIQIHSKWYMKSYTTVQDRYSHPYATVQDIEKQKLDNTLITLST